MSRALPGGKARGPNIAGAHGTYVLSLALVRAVRLDKIRDKTRKHTISSTGYRCALAMSSLQLIPPHHTLTHASASVTTSGDSAPLDGHSVINASSRITRARSSSVISD